MNKKFRMVICGSRHMQDYEYLKKSVETVVTTENLDYNNIEIITGHATGADYLGERFAAINNIPFKLFPADWGKYGKAAGPIRNRQMVDYVKNNPCCIIAFMAKDSRGTKNMIDQSRRANIKVYEFHIEEV